MRLLITLSLILISVTLFCQTTDTIYFQPQTALRSTSSKFFDEVNYIPLQTTKKSTFGRIKQLIIFNTHIIIWDDETNSIFFFDKDGKFIKKYRPSKCIIKSIQLDKVNNALFISGNNKNYRPSDLETERMMEEPTNPKFARFLWSGFYDLRDIKKGRVQELKGFSLALANPILLDNDMWVYSFISANRKWNDTLDFELKVFRNGNIIKKYFPFNKKNTAYYYQPTHIFFNQGEDYVLLFSRPYLYDIYSFSNNSIRLLYHLVLPSENSIPRSFFTYPFRSAGEIQYYRQTNKGLVWQINGLFKLNHYLFFSLDYNKNNREKNFMLDESTRRIFNMGRISTDSSNSFLPLPPNIQFCDGEYLYGSISSNAMFQTMENTKQRNPFYPTHLKEYFNGSSKDANPVIIQLKPKDKIE